MKNDHRNSHRNAHWILPAHGSVNLPIHSLLSQHDEHLAALTSLSAPKPKASTSFAGCRQEAFRRMTQLGKSIFTTPIFRSQLRKPSRPATFPRRSTEP